MTPIYLDYAATTPVDPLVLEAMLPFLQDQFGNAASNTHGFGFAAKHAVDQAREQVATLLDADPRCITFTSGATESINLALQGVAMANRHKGNHIITCQTEHKATLDVCAFLEKQGFRVTRLPVDAKGQIDHAELNAALCDDTILVSMMMVNNETGVIHDIARIADIVHDQGALLHVDAVQAIGKLPVSVKTLSVDLLSVTAHKIYGPKGVGALFVRRGRPKVTLQSLVYGGGHEHGLRSGTLATHQIVGLGKAFELAGQRVAQDAEHLTQCKQTLWQGIRDLPGVKVNGDIHQDALHVLNVCFEGIDGEALIMALRELAVSAGSACTSATIAPSHVLRAMGLSDQQAHSSLRFSFGRMTTMVEMESAIALIREHVTRLNVLGDTDF